MTDAHLTGTEGPESFQMPGHLLSQLLYALQIGMEDGLLGDPLNSSNIGKTS